MAHKVNLEVKGVIENMSWFTGDDGKRYEIFGSGGGDDLAARLEVPLLGRIPLVPRAARGWRLRAVRSWSWRPSPRPHRPSTRCAREVDEELAPTRRTHPELKIM